MVCPRILPLFLDLGNMIRSQIEPLLWQHIDIFKMQKLPYSTSTSQKLYCFRSEQSHHEKRRQRWLTCSAFGSQSTRDILVVVFLTDCHRLTGTNMIHIFILDCVWFGLFENYKHEVLKISSKNQIFFQLIFFYEFMTSIFYIFLFKRYFPSVKIVRHQSSQAFMVAVFHQRVCSWTIVFVYVYVCVNCHSRLEQWNKSNRHSLGEVTTRESKLLYYCRQCQRVYVRVWQFFFLERRWW